MPTTHIDLSQYVDDKAPEFKEAVDANIQLDESKHKIKMREVVVIGTLAVIGSVLFVGFVLIFLYAFDLLSENFGKQEFAWVSGTLVVDTVALVAYVMKSISKDLFQK